MINLKKISKNDLKKIRGGLDFQIVFPHELLEGVLNPIGNNSNTAGSANAVSNLIGILADSDSDSAIRLLTLDILDDGHPDDDNHTGPV